MEILNTVLFKSVPLKKVSELERLQNWHCDQESRIQELKHEIETVKLRLEKRKQKLPSEKMETIRTLNEEYNRLRAEYHSLSFQSGNLE
ncbi:hypothetical protein BVC80_1601g69 [Macleaya cordata]|uniref:Uncharacterized protein n=1 Tax=Macleaya cordata TaxID=56857 RepID=A0A200QA24_MACCD|nr:hypothetical protein BVC80_1601g69 [Macleaya cordata]